MNEAETRAELIAPTLAVVGWGVVEGLIFQTRGTDILFMKEGA